MSLSCISAVSHQQLASCLSSELHHFSCIYGLLHVSPMHFVKLSLVMASKIKITCAAQGLFRRKWTIAPSTSQSPLLAQSCFDCKNFQRKSQFYLLGTQLHVCSQFTLIYEQKVFYEGAVLEICEQESCAMSLATTETLLRLPSCFIYDVSSQFKNTNLFDVPRSCFSKLLLLQRQQTIVREWYCAVLPPELFSSYLHVSHSARRHFSCIYFLHGFADADL